MAQIARSLSKKVLSNQTSEILLRITVGRGKQWRVKSGIFINPLRFKEGRIIKPRANQKELEVLHNIEALLEKLENKLLQVCVSSDAPTKDLIVETIDRFHNPAKYESKSSQSDLPFFRYYDMFLESRNLSTSRRASYLSLGRILHRYELYEKTKDKDFELNINKLTSDDILNFEKFLRTEWQLYDEYPEIYMQYPAELRMQHKTHRSSRRGNNSVVTILNCLRAFFNWAVEQGYTINRPFVKFTGSKKEIYGTPYYLTRAERDKIAEFDLSDKPKLAIQRDIFIFHCLIGCRVSDLNGLKASSVSNGFVEYIADKTRKERATVIRVPLNGTAKSIVERYGARDNEPLLPFISPQRYNDAIKEICRICGIDRLVTILNPTTGKEERKHIYEVASSHIARRTFIGNLYKQVKDPNLIGSMTGHTEGSKAFTRYRDIDDEMKEDIIDLL